MSGTVNVAIMTGLSLVFDVCSVNSDTTGPFLRSLVDLGVVSEGRPTGFGKGFSNGGSECCFSVVDVAWVAAGKKNKQYQ